MNASLQTTINKWLRDAQKQLRSVGITSYPLDCLLIIEHVTGYNRAHILAHPEKLLTRNEVDSLHKLLSRRIKREPLAYILQSCEFYGHNFYVDKRVLVPRPESEAFIELLATLKNVTTLIDVGCGSGAIGISAKIANHELEVSLSDISHAALEVAKKNATHLKAGVELIQQDLLGDHPKHYDVVCANLPYVPKTLSVEKELSYEPSISLFSSNEGMAHYACLWDQITVQKPTYVLTESMRIQHNSQIERAQKAGYQLQSTLGLIQLFEIN